MDDRGQRSPQGSSRWIWGAACLLAPLLLIGLLYGTTVDQPFFWDDVPHFQFATSRSYLQIWTDVRGMSYYRPLAFTLYKLYFALAPHGSTPGAHAILLVAHAANACLVGLAALTLSRARDHGMARLTGLLAALLFAAYPFAALPVAHFAAVMHPLVTTWTLGAVLAGHAFARRGRRRGLVAALVFATLAPFWHESGTMAGTIAAAVALLAACVTPPGRPAATCPWRGLLLLPLAGALFLPIWLIVPRTPQPFEPTGLPGMVASLTFFFQAPTFPAQPLSRGLIDRLVAAGGGPVSLVAGVPWWELAAIWGVGLAALAVAGLVLWRRHQLRILAIALTWTLLAALPSIVALPFPYVSVSQRLLYVAGPPAAILWAFACTSAAAGLRSRPVRRAVALALAALVAAVPVAYVWREMALHQLALAPLDNYAEVANSQPDGRHLVVNPPNWVNYRHPWYPLGHEGVSVSADYVDFEHLVQLNSHAGARFTPATLPEVKAELPHYYYSTVGEGAPWSAAEMAGRAPRFDRVWLTHYSEAQIAVEEAGQVRQGPGDTPADYLAAFDGDVLLRAAGLEVEDAVAAVTLDWHVAGAPSDATVFCHVYDCQGQLLGQRDGPALGRTLPFAPLPPGTEVHDVRRVSLPGQAADGCYTLRVGLYRPDGTRLHATTAGGVPLADDAAAMRFVLDPGP